MEKTHTKVAAVMAGLGRLARFVLCVLTGGFAFPHVFTEGMKVN